MSGAENRILWKIAWQAMVERGFIPEPPPPVLAEVAAYGPADAAAPAEGEPDLRELPWSSIDNPESRDLDQIEASVRTSDGTRLYVAIAEVDHLCGRGTATDGFAAHNATSVYTGVRTFPMLPDRLSFDLTSLLAGATRRAIIIESLVHPDGTVGEGKVYAALVASRAKLDYPSISAWLEGKGPAPAPLGNEPILRAQIEEQAKLADELGGARRRAGALDVETSETRALVDEHGEVVALRAHKPDRAGRIIEEIMIASNRTVARVLEAAGLPSIRRVVRKPERWDRLVAYAAERGFHLPEAPSSVELAKFVARMRETRPPEFAEISLAVIKLMGRGEYVAHAPGEPEIGHFGLAVDRYTHATAPNRRYADLATQRQLLARAAGGTPYALEALAAIAARATEQEAAAQKVERRVHKSAAALLLAPRVGQLFDGIVTGAAVKGTYAKIFEPPVEGMILEGHEGLHVGDRVQLRLVATSVEKGYIDFEVA